MHALAVIVVLLAAARDSGAEDHPTAQAVLENEAGIRLLLDREPHEATEAFRRARAHAPASHVVRRNLAAALAAFGERERLARRLPEAVLLLREAVELHPERLLYRVQLGRVRFQTESEAERMNARDDFRWVLERSPRHLDALVSLGEIEYIERRLDEAVRLWQTARKLRPHDADVATRLKKAEREQRVERLFRELTARNFLIRWSPAVSLDLAAGVRAECERAYGELSKRYQSYPERIVVTLYTPQQFRSATRMHGWVAGLWDGTIRLTVRPRTRATDLRATIYHELTHHLVRSVARDTPVWLHEGLAQLAEDVDGTKLRTAEHRLAKGRSPRVEDLDLRVLAQSDPRRVSRFYDVALAFTASLQRPRNWGGIQDLLQALAAGKTEAQALYATFGARRSELFRRWRDTLPR